MKPNQNSSLENEAISISHFPLTEEIFNKEIHAYNLHCIYESAE